jgi:rhamnosyltransferase
VDNTPPGGMSALDVLGEIPRVTVLRSENNVGLAAALNRGVDTSGESEFLFFLDQDSFVGKDLVSSLIALMDHDPRYGVVSPAPWDAANSRYLDPRTGSRPTVAEMAVVITSAMLVRRSAWDQTNGMREDFFVDCVDQDLCLQIRKAGWLIVQDKSLLLPHSLGETEWHGIGKLKLRATHHPQWRLYWVARNGMMLSHEYFRFDPRWSITNLAILAYWILTVALFEPPRLRGVGVMLRGIGDGLLGRRNSRYLPGESR